MQLKLDTFFKLFLFFMLTFISSVKAGTILVVNTGADSISLINDNTFRTISELPVGFEPHEVVVSPSNQYALVSNHGSLKGSKSDDTVTYLSIDHSKVIQTIKLRENTKPHGMNFISETDVLVTDEGYQQLLLLDLTTGKIKKIIPLPGTGAHMVITDAEKRYGYVTSASGVVCKIDLKTYTVINKVSIGNESEGIALTPDEQMVLATNRKDNILAVLKANNLTIFKKVNVGFGPVRVATYQNGLFAIVTNSSGGNAQTIDLNNFTITKTFKTTLSFSKKYGRKIGKIFPVPNSIVVNADQKTAYITNMYAGNITKIDLDKGTILQTFEANRIPNGLSYSTTEAQK